MIKTILPYKWASESARDLADAIGIKCIRPGGLYQPKANHLIINWGNAEPHFHGGNIINKPASILIARNKLETFCKLWENNVKTPEVTLDKLVAEAWSRNGYKVVCRALIKGHAGHGITIVESGSPIVASKFYTKYIKKDEEFRVHVFNGKIIDFSAKRQPYGRESLNRFVRSYDNGWIFCRQEVSLPECVGIVAQRAVSSLGLNFGAVDVIFGNGIATVLEVNTAPGLDGTTLVKYAQAIKNL